MLQTFPVTSLLLLAGNGGGVIEIAFLEKVGNNNIGNGQEIEADASDNQDGGKVAANAEGDIDEGTPIVDLKKKAEKAVDESDARLKGGDNEGDNDAVDAGPEERVVRGEKE